MDNERKPGNVRAHASERSEAIPGRRAVDLTAERVTQALAELVAVVDRRLPERFYRGEGYWRLVGAALVARIADMLDSIAALVPQRRHTDTQILVRALYEHVVMFCWIAIAPEDRVFQSRDHAVYSRKVLHEEALELGIEGVLTEEQLLEAAGLDRIAGIRTRAGEVDDFWSTRIAGFRSPAIAGESQVLTLRGLYTGLYRSTSRAAHAQIETIGHCITFGDYPRTPATVHRETTDELFWSAIACPLGAMALLVCAYRLGWPDDDTVRAINDGLIRNAN